MMRRFFQITLSKRQKFVMVTSVLTLGLIATQLLVGSKFQYLGAALLGMAAFFLSLVVLKSYGPVKILTLILPTLFTLSVSYFYFLLPVRWITRLPTAILFALGFYATLLTENIFNVSTARTIQLFRAAQAVGFYLTLITAFLLFDLWLSLHLPFFLNFSGVFVISLFLTLPSLWSVSLEDKVEKTVWVFSLGLSLVLAELALAFSFWPIKTITETIALSGIFYTLLGIFQYELSQKLLKRAIQEFLLVAIGIFLLIFLTTSWTNF